jgi:uncharacterized protein (DUF1697 family)
MRFIVLLRGINVGGQNQLRMPDLVRLAEGLGGGSLKTYLQSGNLTGDFAGEAAALAKSLRAALAEALGLDIPVLALSRADWQAMMAANPLAGAAGIDIEKLHVTLLAAPPPDPAGLQARLQAAAAPEERAVLQGAAVYLYCPNGYGRTKLNNNAIERWSGQTATTRNWRTVRALAEQAG